MGFVRSVDGVHLRGMNDGWYVANDYNVLVFRGELNKW